MVSKDTPTHLHTGVIKSLVITDNLSKINGHAEYSFMEISFNSILILILYDGSNQFCPVDIRYFKVSFPIKTAINVVM